MDTNAFGPARVLWSHFVRAAAQVGILATGSPLFLESAAHVDRDVLAFRAATLGVLIARLYFGDIGLFREEGRLVSPETASCRREDPLSATLLLSQAMVLLLAGIAIPARNELAFPALLTMVLALNLLWLQRRHTHNMWVIRDLMSRSPGHSELNAVLRITDCMSRWHSNNLVFLIVTGAIALAAAGGFRAHAAFAYYGLFLLSSAADFASTHSVYYPEPSKA